MGIELNPAGINGAKIWQDAAKPWKVYGAIGESARSWNLANSLPADDTTNTPTPFVTTVTGTSPVTVGVVDGYPLLLTTGATEYDGINLQLRGASASLAANKEAFVRGKWKLSEATQIDFLFGLCELKTDLMKTSSAHGVLATAVEGAFFVKVDGGTSILFKVYKDGTEISSVAVGTMTTDAIDYAIWWDGVRTHAYIDDVEVANVLGTVPDGVLTPSVNVRAGSANARTASAAEWAYAFIG